MALQLPNPITIPATESKTFPLVWLYNVVIHAPGPQHEARVMVEVVPMAVDGELAWGHVQKIESEQFMRAIAEVPEVAAAYQATLAAVLPMQAWVAQQPQLNEQQHSE
jgi:hypothetical protein